MTPEEQQMLGGLVQRVQQTRLTEKDPDAEQMIAQGLGRSPDALYVLAQTVLVQNIALEQAQARIRQLQQQPPPPPKATSFLGSLLGHHDAPPSPVQSSSYPPPQYAGPAYSPAYSVPAAGPMMAPSGSGAGGFLRSAATTAAGVAAGALAFEGIESLMHGGFGGGGFGGFGSAAGMGGGRPFEETVVNNYYDEPGAGGRESHLEHPADLVDRSDDRLVQNADYETRGDHDSSGLDTSGTDSDLDDSVFDDPGDSSDSIDSSDSSGGDFSGGDDSSLL